MDPSTGFEANMPPLDFEGDVELGDDAEDENFEQPTELSPESSDIGMLEAFSGVHGQDCKLVSHSVAMSICSTNNTDVEPDPRD